MLRTIAARAAKGIEFHLPPKQNISKYTLQLCAEWTVVNHFKAANAVCNAQLCTTWPPFQVVLQHTPCNPLPGLPHSGATESNPACGCDQRVA